MHGEAIRNKVRNMCRLYDDTVQQFRQVVIFDIGTHHVNMQPCQDQHCKCLLTKFIISQEEAEEIVDEWLTKWYVSVPEYQLQKEEEQLQKEDPPPPNDGNEEENLLEDLDFTESHSSLTRTNLDIEKKRKDSEKEQVESRRKKKRKADRSENTIIMDNDDL